MCDICSNNFLDVNRKKDLVQLKLLWINILFIILTFKHTHWLFPQAPKLFGFRLLSSKSWSLQVLLELLFYKQFEFYLEFIKKSYKVTIGKVTKANFYKFVISNKNEAYSLQLSAQVFQHCAKNNTVIITEQN